VEVFIVIESREFNGQVRERSCLANWLL